MSAAERKQRQRDRDKAKREQAAFTFAREQEKPPNNVTVQVTKQEVHIVTEQVTISAPLNPTSIMTGFDRLICNFCRKKWVEVEHMLIIAGRNGHGIVAVCDQCSNDAAEDRYCSFCGKSRDEVLRLTEGGTESSPVYICDQCAIQPALA